MAKIINVETGHALPFPERILMVEAIWDTISEDENQIELLSQTKKILDERLDAHLTNPREGSSWDDVKDRIINQF